MINKILKRIFNKYSNVFKFLFYLKYLFLIFFITSLIFLAAPKFFNYSEKWIYIKDYLKKNYNLDIKNKKKIQFNIFPSPNLEINDVSLNFYKNNHKINTQNLIIYPNVLKMYNFKNFDAKKIKLIDSNLKLDIEYIADFYKKLASLKNKISFNNLSIKTLDEDKPLFFLTKIDYSNYGHKKNRINGEVFGKKFKINISEKLDKIDFSLLKTGIFAEIIYINKNKDLTEKRGNFKAKILDSNIKTDFNYDERSLNFKNFFFRNKDLSFESKGILVFNPFLSINLKSSIKDINKNLLDKIDIEKLLDNKDFLKRLNINQEVDFIEKKFSRNFIKKIKIQFSLAYGRLISNKIIILDGGEIICNNELNLIEENPILIFTCLINSSSKKELLKNFSINDKNYKSKSMNLKIKGNFNLNRNQVNFLDVQMDNSYQASEEDLKFFKQSFENILLSDGLIKAFDLKNINKFLKKIL